MIEATLTFWLSALLLTLVTMMGILWPLRRAPRHEGALELLNQRLYRERLDELSADLATQRIDAEVYAQLKLDLDRALLADAALGEGTPRATSSSRPHRAIALLLMVSVPAITAGLYLAVSDTHAWSEDLAKQQQYGAVVSRVLAGQPPAADEPQPDLGDFIRVLQRAVQQDPSNADGWLTLGMALMQARDAGPAREALARAAQLRPDDIPVQLTALQAEITALNGAIPAAIEARFQQLMQTAPTHQGVWLLHGLAHLRAGDREIARASFLRLQALRAEAGVTEAPGGQLAQLLAQTEVTPTQTTTSERVHRVEVGVIGEPPRALPDTAVLFVFARPLAGGGMPLAAQRIPVREFPVRLTLSDADSLSEARPLSAESVFVVQAKLSLTGNADPSDTDWTAAAVPVQQSSASLIRLRLSPPGR